MSLFTRVTKLLLSLTASDTQDVTAANTPTAGDNTKKLATTEFVQTAVNPKAPINNPTFTGTAAAPTPTLDDNTTKIATTAFLRNEFTGTGKRVLDADQGMFTLPGGLIFKWGKVNAVASGGGATVTFTTPFPNNCLCNGATINNTAGNGTALSAGVGSPTASNMGVFHNGTNTPTAITWWAIGY